MLQWLLNRKNRQTLPSQQSPNAGRCDRQVRLGFEQLEDRVTPAGGIVTATLVNGTLTLTGDGSPLGNEVRLLQQGNNDYDIQGQNGTLIKFNATTAATISVFGVTTDIKATFGAGNDKFSYTGLFNSNQRDMTLTMGTGNDSVNTSFLNVRNFTVNQAATDTGNDTFLSTIDHIRGKLTINNNGGNDSVTLDGTQVSLDVTVASKGGLDSASIRNDTYIGGNVKFTDDGTGPNDIRFQITSGTKAPTISKSVSITGGNGGNVSQILNGTFVGGNVTVKNGDAGGSVNDNTFTNSTVMGTLSVTGTNGREDVNLSNMFVAKAVSLILGNGQNNAQISNSTLGATLTIITGTGSDFIDLDATRITGNATITTGTGSDSVDIASNAGFTNDMVFNGTLKVNVGTFTSSDTDNVNLGTQKAVRVSGAATFTGDTSDNLNEGFTNIFLSTKKIVGF